MFGDSQMITKNILWDRQRRESSIFFFRQNHLEFFTLFQSSPLGYQHHHWIGFLRALPENQALLKSAGILPLFFQGPNFH